ncbi:50S ribosomal protein 6, chloroplastic isoform X1 [Prunus persica]|uniref:50S ribosomal protein 6, chloroplastic isoform X1 n=1 Tax=Prunus persica TaxID=3760 RepID=UPI0002C1B174|nr:50S ribosomal protein 6, chloroplastic isoform X1 [Prunus persica]
MGVVVKNPSATASFRVPKTSPWRGSVGGGTGLMIEYSSRPQKKATAHHRKTRPRKTQPWDVKRKPTVYTLLPPLPADWTLVSSADEASSSSPKEPPTTECEGGCVRGIPSKCPVELEAAWIVHRVLKSLDCAASTEVVVALEHQGVCK